MPAYSASIPLLQNRLPLFCFFCAQLVAADGFKTLRGWLKDVPQGYGNDGHSFFHDALASQAGLRLPPDTLAQAGDPGSDGFGAVFQRGAFDQDTAHRLGGCRKEMGAPIPALHRGAC